MAAQDAQGLEARLAVVERQNRRLKWGGIVVLALAAMVWLMGANHGTRTVEAERFVLRDEAGEIRAQIGMSAAGPNLWLYDVGGRYRVRVGVDREGPLILLCNQMGRTMWAAP
jgi:hypothetical protein